MATTFSKGDRVTHPYDVNMHGTVVIQDGGSVFVKWDNGDVDSQGVSQLIPGVARDWEPTYGFCAQNATGLEDLAHVLELVRRQICAYVVGDRCDCKYGGPKLASEATGCPELRELIHRLLYRPSTLIEHTDETTYYLPADLENRFRECVKAAMFGQVEERMRLAWDQLHRVVTAFPATPGGER